MSSLAFSTVLGLLCGCFCLLVVALLIWVIVTYNKLVRNRNQVQASWAQIDVQLKRRWDLIPNIVETAKGYAAHEKGTLEAVIQARNAAAAVGGAELAAGLGGERAQHVAGRLFALAETYPDLKASANFMALQGELGVTEDKISYARQFYNGAVQTLNNATQTFPTNIIAAPFGFRAGQFFGTGEDERGPIQVRF